MTTGVNQGLSDAEAAFKDIIWNSAIKAAESELFTLLPFLGAWGPLEALVTYVVGKFADQLFEEMQMSADLEAIALKNDASQKAYQDASLKLKVIAVEGGKDSDAYKKAIADAQAALAQLGSFSG